MESGKKSNWAKQGKISRSFWFCLKKNVKAWFLLTIKRKIIYHHLFVLSFHTKKKNLEKLFLAGNQSHLSYIFWYICCFQKINIWHTYKGMKSVAEWKQGREKIKTLHELLIWAMILSRSYFQTIKPQYIQFWTLNHCRKYLKLVEEPDRKIIIIVFSPRILSFSFIFFFFCPIVSSLLLKIV